MKIITSQKRIFCAFYNDYAFIEKIYPNIPKTLKDPFFIKQDLFLMKIMASKQVQSCII